MDSDDSAADLELAQDIVCRCTKMLQEMQLLKESFAALPASRSIPPGVGPNTTFVKQEQQRAQKALREIQRCLLEGIEADTQIQKARAHVRFSNVPSMERNWEAVKRCHRLVSIDQRLWKRGPQKSSAKSRQADSVYVDASVDGGAEWLRIVNIEEKRLLHEMAEGGWNWGAESDDDDENEDESSSSKNYDDNDEDISVVRIVKQLVGVARTHWHNYTHPRVHLLLTRINEGQTHEVDKLIRKLRQLGGDDITVIVDCADSEYCNRPVPGLDTAISNLVAQDLSYLGDTVLLDVSVLVALASDISHTHVDVQPWHKSDSQAQIQEELAGKNILLHNAYPHLRGRKLVCTREAADHFRLIISTIASTSEAERAGVILSAPVAGEDGRRAVLDELQRLSVHPVPSDLMLPIQVLVDEDSNRTAQELVDLGKLPEVAVSVEKELLDLPVNRSTFLYGWSSDLTTVTSNGALTRRLVRFVEESLTTNGTGPQICTFPFNRALATKGPKIATSNGF